MVELVTLDRCWLCGNADDCVLVTIEDAVRCVCERCWDRDEPRIPLDLTEATP